MGINKLHNQKSIYWRNEAVWYLLLFGTGILFLLFFSVSTSPLTYNSYCFDSAFFQMLGQNMANGKVMYRDMFDHKGPYFFFLQYLGQILSYGRYGVFFLQGVSACLMLYLADQGCKLVSGTKSISWRIVSALTLFFVWEFTIDCGNLSEEYSLPLLFFCMYLFFRYVQHKGKQGTFLYAFAMGVAFGILAFVRITNAGLICVLVAILFLELLLQKQWLRLISGIGGFLIGVLAASIPICAYYFSKGALSDMLFATFTFNFTYATQSSVTIRYGVIAILAAISLPAAWLNRKERPYCLFSVLSFTGTTAVLIPGNGYIHYYQLIIPPVLGNLWLVIRKHDLIQMKYKKRYLAGGILIIVLLNAPLIAMHGGRVVMALGLNTPKIESTILGHLAHRIEVLDPYGQGMYGYAAVENVSDIMDRIPVEDRDKVFAYGTSFQFPRIAELSPYIKYCLNQESFVLLCPSIGDEIENLLENNLPLYIVLQDNMEIQNDKMRLRLEQHYQYVHGNGKYALYQLKNIGEE